MITRFYIDNFKSLVNFDLELSKFTCLIGLNGAGKSTVLQALDFVSHLMMNNGVEKWLAQYGWAADNLVSNLTRRKYIRLKVEMQVDEKGGKVAWEAKFDIKTLKCVEEYIYPINASVDALCFESDGVGYFVNDGGKPTRKSITKEIAFDYQGSLLSQLANRHLNSCSLIFKNKLLSLRSFAAFSPESLRQDSPNSSKNDKNDIGENGSLLAKFIRDLDAGKRAWLLTQLQQYYPQVNAINTRLNRFDDTVELEITEQYGEKGGLKTKALHLNDGMLRMLAILAEQCSPLETLLFDEIENGINPEVIEKVVDALVASPKQIIVTTHSPMLLNYMTDEVAKEAVMLIYKRADGSTHATRFFDVPSAAQKLESLPPGSAMLDVYLDQVAQEAEHHHAA